MNDTLARALAPHAVGIEELSESHRPVLATVRELLGVVPNCYPILAIWPTALRTFNLLVPNLLNLPGALVGHGAPKDLVGLAMYASSRAAGCPYCIAHHCSYAIRRGADRNAIFGERNPVEAAVSDLADALGAVPTEVTPDHVRAVEAYLPPADVEWIALAVGLGGYLNKFMDATGIELEASAVSDVQALLRPTGWRPGKHFDVAADGDTSDDIPVDGVATYLRVIRQAPGAVRLDRGWTRGVSGRIGPALLMLEDEVGYGFPFLASLGSPRAVRALATALRDNLDPARSRVGLETKLLAGLVYCGHVGARTLADECTLLFDALLPRPDPWLMAAVRRFAAAPAEEADVPPGLSTETAAALLLAKAAAPSPTDVSEITVAATSPGLDPQGIVEIVSWLSLLQVLHRLYAFQEAQLAARGVDPGSAAAVV
jgi:AhpD family alkylhydroperoxidase